MAEPSLSEITSIQGDAAIGAGANGLNISTVQQDSSLPYLQSAAVAISAADKAKTDEYNRRLEASLKNLDETDFSGLLENDFKELSQTWAGLMKTYSDNFDVMRNPNKNPEKWAQIKQQEAMMNANLAAAKDQKKVYDVSQQFLAQNPVWNTDTNRQKLESFLNSPRDGRQLFQFDRPYNPDINTAAKAIGDASTVEVADSQLVNGGRYIRTTEGKTIDMDLAETNARNLIRGNDTFGRATKEGYQQLYDRLPESERSKYTDVEDFFVKNTLAGLNKSSVTKNTLSENRVWLQNDDQAFRAGENEKDRALQRRAQDLQRDIAEGKQKIDGPVVGAYKNELVTKFIETGKVPLDILQTIYGDNKEMEVEVQSEDGLVKNKVKKPTEVVIASSKDENGNFIIDLRRTNAKNNNDVRRLTLTPSDINSDFNRILGAQNASRVADGSRGWLKDKTGKENYDYDAVKSQFTVRDGTETQRSSSTSQESPYKNRTFKFNGKSVANDVLLQNYSTDEIADFIQKGLLEETK